MIWLQSGRERNTNFHYVNESNEKVTEKCCGLASGTQHLQILICGGTGCKASSSQGITDNLRTAIAKNGIADKVEVITVGCFGFCEKGPIVKITPTTPSTHKSPPKTRKTSSLNISSATPNTWISTENNYASPCATRLYRPGEYRGIQRNTWILLSTLIIS